MKKDVLTIQNIQSDLRRQLRGAVILTAVCAILTVFTLWAILHIVFVEGALYGTFRIVFYGVAFLTVTIVGGRHILNLCSALNKPGRIVTDRVVGMETKDHINRGAFLPRCDQSYHLRFASYGEYVIPRVNHSWSSLHVMDADMVYFHAECNDEFYLVLSKPYTGKILLAYNAKMFDYQPPQAGG